MDSRIARLRVVLSVASDMAATVFSFGFSWWLRHALMGHWPVATIPKYALIVNLIVALCLVALWICGAYGTRRRLPLGSLALRVLCAVAIAHAGAAMTVFYLKTQFLSRGVMVIFFAVNCVSILAGRLLLRIVFVGARRRTLIVGTGEEAKGLADALAGEGQREIVGFVGGLGGKAAVPADSVVGGVDDFRAVLAQRAPIDEVALALPLNALDGAKPVVSACEERGVAVCWLLCRLGENPRRTTFERIGNLNVLRTYPGPASAGALLIKRMVDIFGSLIGLLMTGAVFPFVAAAIKLSSRGPVLIRQRRVGLSGRVFSVYKFRTMVADAHALRSEVAHLNEMAGPHFKIRNDPRVTRVGRYLRRLSIDEMPQFWNVLVGDMSLVGPRPFIIEEVEKHGYEHHRRLTMKPGITGIWQTSGRSNIADFDRIFRMDEEYIQNWSLWLDIKLILKTIPVVIGGKGAA